MKDYYDLVYVLAYNDVDDGPRRAARALRNGPFAAEVDSLFTTWRELRARFTSPDDTGPRGYAEQAVIVQPDVPVARLRNDGAAVVNEFLDELRADL